MIIQTTLIFGSCLFLLLIPVAYSESNIYENQEYGFTLQYPVDWILDDEIPQTNKWVDIVSFVPPTEGWSQGIYVNKWEGDLKETTFDSAQYLETHNQAAQDWCASLSLLENGFACMDYSMVNQNTISISGRESFILEESYIRIEEGRNSTVLVYNLQIPDGEDRWTVIGESRMEIINETSNILKNSLNSFTLLNPVLDDSMPGKVPPPKHQLKNSIPINEISCNGDLILIFKDSDNSPACVKNTSVDKLIQRGWAKS
ncbi:MAG: hypothetical protein P8X83_05215 [Nitrosopumilaceae archaeon]